MDVQGIRGFALILVLGCHAKLGIFEGGYVGLDIFYVLSGFLITGLIIREIDKTGRFSIRDFYARRAKRLLPLAALVLIFIGVMSLVLYSTVRQIEVGGDIVAAALYFVNWRFIAQDTDYFAFEDGLMSPVQHYWSLSVEEQFYVLWPLLLLLVATIAVKSRRNYRPMLIVIVAGLAIASLYYSVTYTDADQQKAYFSTLTRGWELVLGGLLALVLPRALRMPSALSAFLVGGGIASIVTGALLFTELDPYPGWRALLPVFGTIAVILGGTATARSLPVRFLSTRPLQYLGKISYAWYLWHWPFIVFAVAIWGELSPQWLVVVTLAAWIPAEISHRTVEEPFRRSRFLNLRPKRALAIGGVCTLATLGVGIGISADRFDIDSASQSEVAGAVVIGDNFKPQESVQKIKPDPLNAREDRGRMYEDGCLVQGDDTESGDCSYGPSRPSKKVVLFGDSHALQYFPAMLKISEKRNWKLVGLARGNCLVADVPYRERCDKWRKNVLERIEQVEKPDLVVLSSSTLDRFRVKSGGRELSRNESQPKLVEGLTRVLKRFRKTGAKVVVIRDQARAPFIPHECVADNLKELKKCFFSPSRREEWSFDRDAAKLAGVKLIDPMPVLCRNDTCPSVIGDVIVYRDTYHLTATFARTLAPWLEKQLPELG
ncbi:MAG: acyltransferase [Actinomycetota bacterium]|nr:acyltransferase [Actinomycetota bacterium]